MSHDDPRREVARLEAQVAELESLCAQLREQVERNSLAFDELVSIFDGINEPIYVADFDTHEILYVNQAAKDLWGDGFGRKCYSYLQGRDAPCPFCTNDKILGEYFGRAYIWEFQNEASNRWFRCIDKAIVWPGGRLVRCEMAIDVTDRKQIEHALRQAHEDLERRVTRRTAELAAANAALKQEIAERKQAEEKIRREQQTLHQMLDLQERERQLVAYEIHDGLAQELTGAMFRFQGFRTLLETDPEEAWKAFQLGLNLLAKGVQETRSLITGLRPPILDESDIATAVEYLICENEDRGGPAVEFRHNLQDDRLVPSLRVAVFRIIQESLTNARRHSGSDRVRLELLQRDRCVQIDVQDWGTGFDPAQVTSQHFGLEGIRQRVRLLGGRMTLDSQPGQGTHLCVELPLIEQPAGE